MPYELTNLSTNNFNYLYYPSDRLEHLTGVTAWST